MTARVAIAAVLVILQAFIYALGNITNRWSIAVCIAYLCATLAVRLWARPRPPGRTFDAQWVSTIGVDVITFSLLNFLQSSGINYTPLFALPVLLSSVLGPILLAFGTAASVTLLLLGDAWWNALQTHGDFGARFLQAGLSGSGFFLVALLANQLALRLAREEKRAKTSQSAARMQIQVNELVIEALSDGVLVVDAKGVVRSANPAARRLLITGRAVRSAPFALASETSWQALADLVHHTFTMQSPQKADIGLDHAEGNATRLQVRTRLTTSRNGTHESLCVMFLEDLREMEARVRTEKMAAMGRMSAAVAHEIRNPLAAISQANALLEEDLQDAGHRQLTGMVRQNAQRLARIVDEVLNLSRAQEPAPTAQTTVAALDETVRHIATDWAVQTGASQRMHVATAAPQAGVWFEAEHLRRLMINLLDNALRYASAAPHAIEVSTQIVAPAQARLSIWSDGQPLEKTVRSHLFEPFFSSESRSSGLGLYICRELCERYGALIGYQRVLRGNTEGNEFFVVFRSAAHRLGVPGPSFDTMNA
ncbi:sensor histidine kinase [Polaromonas jejuensis]|uniref:histidine kinase n=1 Tax=Polaromonas jejuensis TaxID=457502 RepID=A0ABW0Q7P1_9BURK|nr:ATP-binding protein [Polaromonas jejuensis]